MKPDRARVLYEGLITGLLGYLVIVLFYGLLNLATGLSFFATAARLGAGLVSVERGGAVGAVLAFNGLHVVALFIGVAGLIAIMAAFLSFAAGSGIELPIGSVFAANLLAGAVMGTYLLKAHPRLWSEIRDHLDPETEHPVPH